MAQLSDSSWLKGKRIATDVVSEINLIENHDEVYTVWRDAGARNRILIHIDAYHDMW